MWAHHLSRGESEPRTRVSRSSTRAFLTCSLRLTYRLSRDFFSINHLISRVAKPGLRHFFGPHCKCYYSTVVVAATRSTS